VKKRKKLAKWHKSGTNLGLRCLENGLKYKWLREASETNKKQERGEMA